MSIIHHHIYDCECFHMPFNSLLASKTVDEFHSRPLTQSTLNHIVHHVINGMLLIQLTPLHAG